MTIRSLAAALAVALILAASAQAQDDSALDYAVDGGVVGADPATMAPAVPATVYPMAPPTLAYNYYYPTPGVGQVPARLYLCPRPTPAHVGYTYITYQALAPHNFLYRHRAAYVSPYNGGVTITTVRWR